LKWDPDTFHVLFASGNGDPVKRQWLADGTMKEASLRGIHAQLHYMTRVPNSEVPAWLNASDALLLTSQHEGSPTIIKEALACGLPIVSVPVGDVIERIGNVDGCHVAQPDASALADKICAIRARGERLDARAQLNEISSATIAHRLHRFYQSLSFCSSQATPVQVPIRVG
jgi:glycosyltransferase involved in cell wall biosynthesis